MGPVQGVAHEVFRVFWFHFIFCVSVVSCRFGQRGSSILKGAELEIHNSRGKKNESGPSMKR